MNKKFTILGDFPGAGSEDEADTEEREVKR